MTVTLVDTSVLCNLLPVPGFDQRRAEVVTGLADRRAARESLILPVTAVIETGNHIAHLADGGLRRQTATTFVGVIESVLAGASPWTLHEFRWGTGFLRSLLDGGGSDVSLVDHATRGVGVGDLCILAERRAYAERAQIPVGIWTIDRDLLPYAAAWRAPPRSG